MSGGIELRRIAAFSALAIFVALSWVQMLAAPPLGRTALACLPVLVALLLLLPLRRARLPGWLASVLGAVLLAAATAAGLAIVGLPVRLLAPAGWHELLEGVDAGFAGIGEGVKYPYDGPNAWSRLIMLLGAPLIVGIAALLSFLPLRRDPLELRLAGLGVLVAGYAMAVTIHGPRRELLAGVGLALAIATWIWLPRLRRRRGLAAGALLTLALVAALPLSSRLAEAEALVDYKSWKWSAGPGTSFTWDHSYGPIDWERDGETVMQVESDEPNYWKTSVLDRFDGRVWERSGLVGPPLELPVDVEPEAVVADLEDDWFAEASVTVAELRTELVPGPGTEREVTGGITAPRTPDHAVLRAAEPLSQGDAYEIRGYAPDPSAARMRASGWEVPERLAGSTELLVPNRVGGPIARVRTRGIREQRAARAAATIAGSPYARMAALSARLTADAPTAYDAVKAIESHLLTGYEYSEDPPARALPIDSFLFEDRIGYCQHFSGAMALMLRLEGIPTRVVAGFSPGVPVGGERFRVRDLDAHSWVEVYFAGIGWVPFDPTPPASPAELRNGGAAAPSSAASSLGALLSGARGFGSADPPGEAGRTPDADADDAAASRQQEPASTVPLLVVVGLLAAGSAAFLAPGLLRRALERRRPAQAAVDARVAELGRALDRLRFGHSPDATLLELERALRSRAEPGASRYVERLRRLRFAPGTVPDGTLPGSERRALRRRLGAGRGLAGRIAAYRVIPPLSPRG